MTAQFCFTTLLALLAISALSGTMLHVTDAPTTRVAKMTFLVGSRGDRASGSLERFVLDLQTGAINHLGTEANRVASSFLARSQSGRLLCSVGTVRIDGKTHEAADLFAINPTGDKLQHLDRELLPDGGACHVIFDANDEHVLISIYGDGQEIVLPVEAGRALGEPTSHIKHPTAPLGPQKDRQDNPHAHSTLLAPGGKVALVADLGADRVILYNLVDGSLQHHEPPFLALPAGSGPRHMTFDGSGEHLYVLNELTSTIGVFKWDGKTGAGTLIQIISMLPDGYAGPTNTAAEIQFHPSGHFLYATNRGHDSIAIFSVDSASGLLTSHGTEPTRGKHPRHFTLDPTGHWLIVANLQSDSLAVFSIDAKTGELKPMGDPVKVPAPYCVRFLD